MNQQLRQPLLSAIAFLGFCAHSAAALQTPNASPQDILIRALKQFRAQKGMHFEGTERNYNPFMNVTAEGRFSGTYRATGEIHYQCADQFGTTENEVYVLGKRVLRREPHTDRWKEKKEPNEGLAQILPLSATHILVLPGAWMEAALATSGTLEAAAPPAAGIAAWVIRLRVEGEATREFSAALQKALGGETARAASSHAGPHLEIEFRIAKQSFLIERLKIEMSHSISRTDAGNQAGSKSNYEFADTLSIDYRDYNQALELGFPPQLKRLLSPDATDAQAAKGSAGGRAPAAQKASDLMEKAWEKSLQQAGYRFEFDSQTDPLNRAFTADGIFRKAGISEMRANLVYNEMHARYYLKGETIGMTFPTLGDRCLPFRLDRELAKSHPHPQQIFLQNFGREARALAMDMKLGAPDKLDGRLCQVAEYGGDMKTLTEKSSLLGWDARAADGSWTDFPLTGLEIMKGMEGWSGEGVREFVRNLSWKIWIGSEDGLIYRMQRRVTTRIELTDEKWRSLGSQVRNGRPYRGQDFVTVLDLRIEQFNMDLDTAIPAFVQQFFRYQTRR
ncbi:MAG TPA: hypothetical protein VGQ81_08785 [Acidobacteriota bacterium]|nr:hypothetical protein [Acidobacteriota bacterium]